MMDPQAVSALFSSLSASASLLCADGPQEAEGNGAAGEEDPAVVGQAAFVRNRK